jgi:nucleoside-diphosphate-sugar epimerase
MLIRCECRRRNGCNSRNWEQILARYLITGGAGFIGSSIAEALLERGESIRILDDFSTGNRENLVSFTGRMELFEGSITDSDLCRRAVHEVDYVIHQAALASVPRSVEQPLASNAVNVTGTLNLLIAARDAKVRRFVFAGSSSVYGDTPELPKRESMAPNPLSPYAVAKYAAECYCSNFYRLYGLETVVLRYFNVFGPRQDPASQYAAVIPKFINSLLRGQAPTIHGDGNQTRDFTYISNVVQANLLACESAGAAGEVLNCACGNGVTLNKLYEIVQNLIGTDIPAHYGPARPGDIRDSLADITKAQNLLGYQPEVDLRDGLAQAVNWYRTTGARK